MLVFFLVENLEEGAEVVTSGMDLLFSFKEEGNLLV